MLGLKLNHVSKRGHWRYRCGVISIQCIWSAWLWSNSSGFPEVQSSNERGSDRISYLVWSRDQSQGLNVPAQKLLNGYQTAFFPYNWVEQGHQELLWWLWSIQGLWISGCEYYWQKHAKIATFSFRCNLNLSKWRPYRWSQHTCIILTCLTM